MSPSATFVAAVVLLQTFWIWLKLSSTGVSRPKISTRALTLCDSALISVIVACNVANGPSTTMTESDTSKSATSIVFLVVVPPPGLDVPAAAAQGGVSPLKILGIGIPLAYSLIGFSRLFVTGVALYFLGRWWGARFLTWTERQLGSLPTIYRWFRTAIDRAGWLLVLLMPGSNLVCMMAGYRRMRVSLFTGLLAVGIVGKLAVLWAGGRIFEDQIKSFLDAISKYQWWIVIGLFAVSFLQSGMSARKNIARLDAEAKAPPVDEPTA